MPTLPDRDAAAKLREAPLLRLSHSALIPTDPALTSRPHADPMNPWICLKLLGAGLLMVAVLYVVLFRMLTEYVLFITRNQP